MMIIYSPRSRCRNCHNEFISLSGRKYNYYDLDTCLCYKCCPVIICAAETETGKLILCRQIKKCIFCNESNLCSCLESVCLSCRSLFRQGKYFIQSIKKYRPTNFQDFFDKILQPICKNGR